MRHRIISIWVILLFMSILLVVNIPTPTKAVSIDPYEIYPGDDPRWFDIQDFKHRGDKLELTIVYKKTSNGSFQERPVSVLILQSSMAQRNPKIEVARGEAIFIREDITTRLELTGSNSIVNPKNSQMSLLFYNELQDGDLLNWDESAVKVRVDYQVTPKIEEKSNFLLILILVLLIILIVVGGIGLGYYAIKRRVKDTRTFFNPEGHLFYVFRDIDGSIMYFTEEQYTHLYNQNALVTFEYLGQATKKGGPVMIPIEEQGMYEEGMAPIFAQPEAPVILNAPQQPQPLPVASRPSDQYRSGQSEGGEDLYGTDLYSGAGGYEEEDSDTAGSVQEEAPPLEGDGSGGVLDELVSGASTVTEEPTEEEMIMRLGKEGEEEQEG